jgi:hypothetical protein
MEEEEIPCALVQHVRHVFSVISCKEAQDRGNRVHEAHFLPIPSMHTDSRQTGTSSNAEIILFMVNDVLQEHCGTHRLDTELYHGRTRENVLPQSHHVAASL